MEHSPYGDDYCLADQSVFAEYDNDLGGGDLFIPLFGPGGRAASVNEDILRNALPSGPLDLSKGVLYRICVYAPPDGNMPQDAAELVTELLCVDALGDVVDEDMYDDMCDSDEPNEWVEFERLSCSDVETERELSRDECIDYDAIRIGSGMWDNETPYNSCSVKEISADNNIESRESCITVIGEVVMVGNEMPIFAEMIDEVPRFVKVINEVPQFAEVIDEVPRFAEEDNEVPRFVEVDDKDSQSLIRVSIDEGRSTPDCDDGLTDGRTDELDGYTIPPSDADDASLSCTTSHCYDDLLDGRTCELEGYTIPTNEGDDTSLPCATPDCYDDLSDGRTDALDGYTIPPSEADDTSLPCAIPFKAVRRRSTELHDTDVIPSEEAEQKHAEGSAEPSRTSTPGCQISNSRSNMRRNSQEGVVLEPVAPRQSECDEDANTASTADMGDDNDLACGAHLIADVDQPAGFLAAEDGSRRATSEDIDDDFVNFLREEDSNLAPKFVRSDGARGRSRVTLVESQIDHLGAELQFIKDTLGSLVDSGNECTVASTAAEIELPGATEKTPKVVDQVIGCCQTDDSLLDAFLHENPDFLARATRHCASQTENVRSLRRKSTARSVAFSVLSDDANSDIDNAKRGVSEDLVGEALKDRFSVRTRKSDKEDFDVEIRTYNKCFQECEEWVANVQFFSLPVRHLGPEGGIEQENLFGARVRSNSLLRHSRTMDQWKSWATQYLMTTGRELENDDRVRCSVMSEAGKGCREEAFDVRRRTTANKMDLASLNRVEGDESAWVAVWSAEYQRCYYWNDSTDEVTWVQPVTEED
eukprot:GEMP01008546.1.p1 GENE.GEMP01008546.1~~GEMP01008546.1.p1  ORF type:complete len:816 (+),score=205.26 GEMP01008546.1:324-2771(+)